VSRAVGALLERCRAAGLLLAPDGDALHVDFECDPPGELIEELRRRKPEVMAALAGATVIAPPEFCATDPAGDEPPYDERCPMRVGLVRRPAGRFEHFCVTCGRWGAFGYDVSREQPGRWFCLQHRPDAQ
jgi:hypothetical protein